MRPFLILGRPRSRTAWLSNFLTWKGTWCYHEASVLDGGLHELLEATGCHYAGTADSGLVWTAKEALEELPDARLVLLDGPGSKETFARWAEARGGAELVEAVEEGFQCARSLFLAWDAIVVDPGEIPRESAVQRVWGHVSEEPFPEARYRMLRHFNVQVTQEYLESLL